MFWSYQLSIFVFVCGFRLFVRFFVSCYFSNAIGYFSCAYIVSRFCWLISPTSIKQRQGLNCCRFVLVTFPFCLVRVGIQFPVFSQNMSSNSFVIWVDIFSVECPQPMNFSLMFSIIWISIAFLGRIGVFTACNVLSFDLHMFFFSRCIMDSVRIAQTDTIW